MFTKNQLKKSVKYEERIWIFLSELLVKGFNLVRCTGDEVSCFIMTLPAPRRECIFGDVCVVAPTSPHSRLSPLGRAGLKSGLIKFLVRCERENKMGQRVKYCTGLHFASGELLVAKREGEKREPGRASW